MVPVFRALVLLSVACYSTSGYSQSYRFDQSTCEDDFYYSYIQVADDETYYLSWNGDKIDTECQFKFDTTDTDQQLCVETMSYSVHDCDSKLYYYGGLLGDILYRTHSCAGYPSKFCGQTDGDIAIKLRTPQFDTTNSNSFSLKISSNNTQSNIGLVVGLSVSGSICIFIIIMVVLIIRRRRRLATNGWLMRSTAGGQTVVNTSSAGMIGGYTNHNYPHPQQPYTVHAPPPYPGRGYNDTPYQQSN